MERIKLNIQKFADNTVEVELVAIVDELQKSISKAVGSLNKLKKGINDTKKETYGLKDVAKGIKDVFSKLDLTDLVNGMKRLTKTMYSSFISKAVDTSEELNLFNVVFDNMQKNGEKTFSVLGKEATKFQNTLNEAFGTNKKETMRYQGLFQAMGESAGLDEYVANVMSKNMTKLAYDLASLYNTTETKAAESLRAGVYAGQTKPLRNYGIDVTQTSFKPLMEELGLEKSVSELTQAEKEILRYISTLRQAQNAMGDFANTIESPANQLKVLKQQFYEMQAAIGNLFTGAFARMLPYINGIIMAIKEVAKAIASFFGIDMKDYNTGIASYENDLDEYSDGLGGVADSAGGASDAIKELKRQTLAFDQINNLTSPTPSSSSGGSGGGAGGGVLGGIDNRLLDAIKGYENGMDKVKMKATEIRDKLMDFLGFTKHINEETGEVYFTYDGWQKTVSNIWEWFTKLNPLAKIFTGLGVAGAIVNIFRALKKISDLTGVTPVLKGTLTVFKELLSPAANLTTKLFSFSKAALQSEGGIKNLTSGLSKGVQAWREQQGIIDKTTGKLNGFKGVLQGTKNFALGLAEGAVGIGILSSSIKDLKMNGADLQNVLGTVGGTALSIFGGAQAGAIFGPWGAAIGGLIGTITSLGIILTDTNVDLLKSIEEVGQSTAKVDEFNKKIEETNQKIEDEVKISVGQSNYHQRLVDELKEITDENGRVKEGYEDRAQFIVTTLREAFDTELSYSDGIVQGYQDQIKAIEDTIEAEKRKAKFEGLKKHFNEYMQNEVDIVENLNTAIDNSGDAYGNLIKAVDDYNKLQEKHANGQIGEISYIMELTDKTNTYNDAYNKWTEAVEKRNTAYDDYFDQLLKSDAYERAMVANSQGNYDEVDRIVNESTEQRIEALRNSMVKEAEIHDINDRLLIAKWTGLVNASKEEYKKGLEQLPKDTATQIQIATGRITDLTPEVIDAYAKIGEKSEDELLKYLRLIPEDMQEQVVDKLKEKGVKIPEEIQKGIDGREKPKVDVEVSSSNEIQDKVNNSLRPVSAIIGVDFDVAGAAEKIKGHLNYLMSLTRQAEGGVFANGKWQKIQAYANGGIPSGGQLFMAREAGPELVGKIGRHTAVMNNNQIVDSVKAGVYEAVSAAMSNGGGNAIEVYVHTDEGTVIDRINRTTRQTGVCPIRI